MTSTTNQTKISIAPEPFVQKFATINRGHVLFHTLFILTLSMGMIIFGLLFSRFLQSIAMALWLAGIFLTVFTYLVLLFYLQGRRPERLMQLRDEFMEMAHSRIPFEPGTIEYHCCITESIVHFIGQLRIPNVENRFVLTSETLTYLVGKFLIWTRWKDLLKLKEMLLLTSIEEHIRLIKRDPTDLEAHSSLASNYVTLATLYQDPRKLALNQQLIWTPPEYESDEMRKKFEMALQRAIEEYHIIDAYAPNNPWVHAQKAALYKELDKPDAEQKEYEQILTIDPQNVEILFRLGKLYFRKGENVSGLKIYDQLQDLNEEKAQELITYYDAYSVEALRL
jgi:tetratricopeptide (TPR) repeat protein